MYPLDMKITKNKSGNVALSVKDFEMLHTSTRRLRP